MGKYLNIIYHLWIFILTDILPLFQCLKYLQLLRPNINLYCPVSRGLPQYMHSIVYFPHNFYSILYPSFQPFSILSFFQLIFFITWKKSLFPRMSFLIYHNWLHHFVSFPNHSPGNPVFTLFSLRQNCDLLKRFAGLNWIFQPLLSHLVPPIISSPVPLPFQAPFHSLI